MSIANYTDLQASVASWLSRANMASLIPDFIMLAENKFNRLLRTRDMELSATITPVDGVFPLPSDYLELRRIYRGTVELEYIVPEQFWLRYPVSCSSKYYTIEGNNCILSERSNTDVEVLYYQRIPDLATNTTNWLLTANPDLYLAASLSEAYDVIKDENRAVKWGNKASFLLEQLKTSDKQGKYSGSAMRVIAA